MSPLEAEQKLMEILQPINTGAERAKRIGFTFEEFVELVYLPVCYRKWKASTAMTEVDRIQFHLVRSLGPKAMQKIKREEMQSLLDLKAREAGRSVVDHLRFRLRSIFELALSEGVVDRNPAATLFTPRNCRAGRERLVLSQEQAVAMLAALDMREKVIARLATWEGMRPGEILALQLGDLDGDSLWVRRRLYKGDLDVPKTRRSSRQAALTTATLGMLKKWTSRFLEPKPDAWLFPSENGLPLRRDNVWRRYMLPKLKAAGLEWSTFQVMRRTFATLSKEAGVDAHTRSAQMGNTVDVNENEYAVANFEKKLAAVRRLESAVVQ
jgi:integrase